jgi:hypothetical protein
MEASAILMGAIVPSDIPIAAHYHLKPGLRNSWRMWDGEVSRSSGAESVRGLAAFVQFDDAC